MATTALTDTYTEIDVELIGLFQSRQLVGIRSKMEVIAFFDPSQVWDGVGCFLRQEENFYRNLIVTQVGLLDDVEVRLNLRAPGKAEANPAFKQGNQYQWAFSYETALSSVQDFLETLEQPELHDDLHY